MTILDSGVRQEFETGSKRDTREGKGRFDLLPVNAITRVAKHFEGGAKKYDERNWEKGQPLSRYADSALRHLFKYLGNYTDEDHLAAAAWNVLCLMETEERITKLWLSETLRDLPNPNLSQSNARTPDPGSDKDDMPKACSTCGKRWNYGNTMCPECNGKSFYRLPRQTHA
jgi:hypothetical protein